MAGINLCAVLRTLEHLPPLDPESAGLAAGPMRMLRLHAPGVDTVRLAVGGGRISHHHGSGPADIALLLPRPSSVNGMFDGTSTPLPTKGFRQISWLKGPFQSLTDRLSFYLRPTPALLEDPEYVRVNSVLTLHLAAYALAEVGNRDPAGAAVARSMPDGDVQMAVREGPALVLQSRGGRLSVRDGASENWRALMMFADLDGAGQVLRGELASVTAVGRGVIALRGYVPMLDKTNKLLGLLPRYLS